MPRKAVDVGIIEEGDARYVVLSYADGTVARRRVDASGAPRRKPRRPQTRLRTEETVQSARSSADDDTC